MAAWFIMRGNYDNLRLYRYCVTPGYDVTANTLVLQTWVYSIKKANSNITKLRCL